MKKLVVIGLILPMIMGSMCSAISVNNLQDVYIDFQSGFGIRIIVWNDNDCPIYNVSLESIAIDGLLFFGLGSGVHYLQEIGAGRYGYLVTPVFGFGWLLVTVTVSYYDDQGNYMSKEVHANLFAIGTVVLVLEEW